MAQTNVQQFAGELGLQSELLLEQLRAAGVEKKAATDLLSEQDKTRLLEYLRKMHGGGEEGKQKITLTRRETTEIRKSDATGKEKNVAPRGDNRLRDHSSKKLWVINRIWSTDKKNIVGYGVIQSIERTIYSLKDRQGKWVRYENYYHPLHSPEELQKLLNVAKRLEYGFFNNEAATTQQAPVHTKPAPFILLDEFGPRA